MPIAFKEWAVTVRALAEGEQLLTLRKGGIREENKHFELEHERFFLYPTFDHQRNDLVRESHHPELRRALEEGVWPDEEPPPKALLQDGGIPQPDRVRLRAWAEVTDHVTINDRRTVDSLSPYYVWTPDYAEKRLNWKRRHPLHILLLRVHRIPRPVTVRVRDEYHGCRSWVEIDRDLPFEGTPVMADEEFDRARAGDPRSLRRRRACARLTGASASSVARVRSTLRSASLICLVRRPQAQPRMSWIETESLSFTARHDTDDSAFAERTLDRMEDLRLRLEDRFEQVPGEVTVVIHTNPAWLTLAHPFLPAARWSAAPAGRRYLAGWAMATELHVLNDPHMERRAAGDDSREALRGTAERLYAQLVIAANNPALPPSWTPRRFARYLRWAWLVEGGAQYFARQVGLYRAAVIRRLRESARPSFPPSRRDAVILGGTIFDLLENERGPEACERLVHELQPGGAVPTLEDAFDARFRDIEAAWRDYLRRWPGPAASAELVEDPDEDQAPSKAARPRARGARRGFAAARRTRACSRAPLLVARSRPASRRARSGLRRDGDDLHVVRPGGEELGVVEAAGALDARSGCRASPSRPWIISASVWLRAKATLTSLPPPPPPPPPPSSSSPPPSRRRRGRRGGASCAVAM